jgi:hypothetical protein
VASTLLNRGRSNVETIARLAGLPRSTTGASLLILIQHSLVGSTGGSRRAVPEEEQYEFDTAECLMRLRWGRILALTESNFGEDVSHPQGELTLGPDGRATDACLRQALVCAGRRRVRGRQEA